MAKLVYHRQSQESYMTRIGKNQRLTIVSSILGVLMLGSLLPTLAQSATAGAVSAPGNAAPSLITAFLAGLISFLSPCVLPLVPSYLAMLAGNKKSPLVGAISFIAGFSLVFIVVFGLPASVLGGFLRENRDLSNIISGVLFLVFGVALVFAEHIPFLAREYRSDLGQASRYGPAVLGAAFAAGWTPCIGPVLGVIVTLAGNQGSVGQGVFLVAIYALGLAVPFLLAALAWSRLAKTMRFIGRYAVPVQRFGGVVLMLMGVLLVTGQFTILNQFLQRITPSWMQL
jgi:cytochrome c-type biogenesis protein